MLCRRLSPTTQETYRRDLDRYVLPRFGSYRLGQLPADEIENWLNDEIASGIAPSSVHRHYRTLRRMLVDSGMRWSELVGLRRGKVYLRNRKVRVREQLVQLEDRSWLRKEPKTSAGVRSITLSPFTAARLSAHIDRYAKEGADALVFANAAGTPLSASSFLTHHFSKAQRAAGVKCRFHDLRHTSVALAIAAGAHPKAIQSRMGHSSISVTLDRYGHLLPELDEAIAEAFGRSLSEASERRLRVVVNAEFTPS